ncbi:hypothetical protein [Desulfobacter postgatei]|uniref:Uncharacterized protein n=1 Tax=Desulfobacter postgatei 2ac9 TaxID=879212 RepID=I5AXW4_9BACT|nr:hypothetical protein [Desulfobacter postgatei]EIM62077.1 hypothetical protein DespoDRAFT_00020 [Desulfobacter postgatei 2ac9]
MDYNLKCINNKFFGILVILMIILGFVLQVGCVPQSEYDDLLAENEELKARLEECMHGAEKLIANAEKAYKEKKYEIARNNIKLLHEKHPESPKNEDFKQLLKTIEIKEMEEIKRKEEEEKERIRIANLNNTGMWGIRYFVDDFGEKTDEKYISNEYLINGSFSNSATQNSKLTVRFVITREDISILLYEYAGDNPVKAIGYNRDKYYVHIKDSNNEKLSMNAELKQDRLSFNKNSKEVHSAFMKGGSIMFKIEKNHDPINVYHFTIENADWYENAYRKLNN